MVLASGGERVPPENREAMTGMRKHGTRPLELFVQRFHELSDEEQLRVYREIRAYLGEAIVETKVERRLDEQLAALEAMRAVAGELGLAVGQAPSPNQFDAVAAKVAPGWNRSRVVRAWGRWRHAKTVFLGKRTPLSATREARKREAGSAGPHEDPVSAVRLWLASEPRSLIQPAYNHWAAEYNDALAPGELRVPSRAVTISSRLGLIWEVCIGVARGEYSLEDAPRRRSFTRETVIRGEHNFIGLSETVALLKTTHPTASARTTYRRGFPTPVLIKLGRRFWLQEDIEAYVAGKPVPARHANELGARYLDSKEVAALVGIAEETLRSYGSPRVPRPTAVVKGMKLWLRSEAEEHNAAWQAEQAG